MNPDSDPRPRACYLKVVMGQGTGLSAGFGLHARPSFVLRQAAERFRPRVEAWCCKPEWVSIGGQLVPDGGIQVCDLFSQLDLMMMAICQGDVFYLKFFGEACEDARDAVAAVIAECPEYFEGSVVASVDLETLPPQVAAAL